MTDHNARFLELKAALRPIAPEASEQDIIHAAGFLNRSNCPVYYEPIEGPQSDEFGVRGTIGPCGGPKGVVGP